jgi:hypothetical protein
MSDQGGNVSSEFIPTYEQVRIHDAFQTGESLVIDAGAGTGKTSTLEYLGRSTDRKGLYIAYNKSVQTKAAERFPTNVECRTAHSLAYKPAMALLNINFKQMNARLNGPVVTAAASASILGITEGMGNEDDDVYLSPSQLARLALETVENFCYSDDDTILERHVPKTAGTEFYFDAYRARVKGFAEKAWADLTSKNNRLAFQHDHYLKMWALTKPKLKFDFIMLDEAQDANPVIANVVNAQTHAQRIMVGDRCQSIYGWRGAVDAMSDFKADHRLVLQKSFRFGPAIAAEANKWLTMLNGPLRLEGHEPVGSVVAPINDMPHGGAILCRTNAAVMQNAIEHQRQGKHVAIVGGASAIKAYAKAAIDLMSGRRTDHSELCAFKSWADVQTYCREERDAGQLKMIVNMIDTYGPQRIIEVATACTREDTADVIISTAHKAKGREWDYVQIATDFTPKKKDDGTEASLSRADMMLAYVSVTRAKKVLDNLGLAWVDDLLGEFATNGV